MKGEVDDFDSRWTKPMQACLTRSHVDIDAMHEASPLKKCKPNLKIAVKTLHTEAI